MKIREFSHREPYEETLRANVRNILSVKERNVLVTAPGTDAAQIWYRHLLYDVYVPHNFDAEGRAWLARLYGYAPRRERRIPQWLVCQMSRLDPFHRLCLRPAFGTTVDFGTSSMIMPGNQRFRLYQFQDQTILSTTKHGFSTDGLEAECAFRQRKDLPDFVMPCRIPAPNTMEEALLDAVPINRIWQQSLRDQVTLRLCIVLDKLRNMDVEMTTGPRYAAILQSAFESAWQRLSDHFFGITQNSQCTTLFHQATQTIQMLKNVTLCRSHGDFQPGNLLMSPNGQMTVIDWEDTAIRSTAYDAMVYILNAHSPNGLADRAVAFLRSASPLPPHLDTCGLSRAQLLALRFCEDCIWQFQTAARDGIYHIPDSLKSFFREAANAIVSIHQ